MDKFLTDFCPYEAGIIDIVTQILLPSITGDLEPEPPRSEVAEAHNLSHAQETEIRYAILRCSRRKGSKRVNIADVGPCLDALQVPAATAEEMLGILGELDLAGAGFVEKEVLVDFVAGRYKQRFVTEDPVARDLKEERRKMVRRGIRAELYKLNVYSGPSGLFRPHVDTPRSEVQIGSLVVCLPVPFDGGALAVTHQQEEVVYDWAGSSSADGTPFVQWAAFYSDCEHEVLEVTSGHRVTLTYNLFLAPGTSLLAGRPTSLDRERLPLAVNLRNMLANADFMPDGGYIGIHLAHYYPHTHNNLNQFVPNMLKGVDMVFYESVSVLHLPATLCTISANNVPPHGTLDSLDEMEERAAEQLSKVQADLSTFTTDGNTDYEATYRDEIKGDTIAAFDCPEDLEGLVVMEGASDEVL